LMMATGLWAAGAGDVISGLRQDIGELGCI
jgi:hypothetical protein